MKESNERAARRLQHTSAEAHIDSLQHPDPCGTRLVALVRAIETRTAEAGESATAYARLACDSQDPVIASVMRLLADDEERHHQLCQQIGRTLRDRLNWVTPRAECAGGVRSDAERLEAVRAHVDDEQRGSLCLRDLASRAREEGDTLTCLLLEGMAMDSDKHARLLRSVGRRLIAML
jgi:hypothetical protein